MERTTKLEVPTGDILPHRMPGRRYVFWRHHGMRTVCHTAPRLPLIHNRFPNERRIEFARHTLSPGRALHAEKELERSQPTVKMRRCPYMGERKEQSGRRGIARRRRELIETKRDERLQPPHRNGIELLRAGHVTGAGSAQEAASGCREIRYRRVAACHAGRPIWTITQMGKELKHVRRNDEIEMSTIEHTARRVIW